MEWGSGGKKIREMGKGERRKGVETRKGRKGRKRMRKIRRDRRKVEKGGRE